MENENKTPIEENSKFEIRNSNSEPQAAEPQAMPAQAVSEEKPAENAGQEKSKKGWKVLAFAALVLAVGALGYFGYQNPELFKADITVSTVQHTVPTVTKLYIPNYDTNPQDNGMISIKTKNSPVAEDVVSMSFKLKYTPVDALIFNENSIILDGSVFSSADLKSVNTSTPGEVVVSFFSSTPATLNADDQVVMKLVVDVDATPGSEINLQIEDVEVVEKDGSDFEVSDQFTTIAAEKMNVTSQSELRVLNAEAISSNTVLIRFSDLLQNEGQTSDYDAFSGVPGGLTPSEISSGYGIEDYDQSTVIVQTDGQTAGREYTLRINAGSIPGSITGNTQGYLDPDYIRVTFDGYVDPNNETDEYSPVVLDSDPIVSSSTEVTLNLSGSVKESSVTPINIEIKELDSGNDLTISDVELVNGDTIHLTTAQQVADEHYFIRFNGVEDAGTGDLLLTNNKSFDFFGKTVPAMSMENVSPSTVTNGVSQVVVILGQNLDTVTTARIDTTQMQITEQTAGALSINIPAGFAEGVYGITLVSQSGATATLENALAVSNPETPMRIVSEESRAIPNRIAPDGETEITFWVLVEDPVALGNIDSVNIDLEQIGGNRAQEMEKDLGLQSQYQQFYKYTTTVAEITPTQEDPYQLAVQVRKGDEVANGTVEVVVTRDILGSVAPTMDQIYVSPTTVAPDGETLVKISAKISDPDGAGTITSVVADLGPLGVGFVPLSSIDVAGEANEQVTGWFESEEFTIPITTAEGNYTISVSASDDTGESVSTDLALNVSTSLTGPTIDPERSYLGPRNSIPKDGRTPFAIHVMVSDPNGVSDIDTVTAYFGTLGLTPVPLLKDPNASENANSALYSSQDVTVPTTAPFGAHEIEVVASDSSGGTGSVILQMEVTYEDFIGDSPIVFDEKSYTNPKIAINDGQTRVTLYAFVRDDDNDLESVVVNLSGVGQVGPELPPDFGQVGGSVVAPQAGDGTCPTNSNTIVCMEPSYKEGRDGQWFILPDVTISTTTPASSEPYMVEVIATDAAYKTARGALPVSVRDSQGFEADKNPPEIVGAVPVAPGKIEVVFNEEVSALSVSSSGDEFTITEQSDINNKLNVVGATINAAGNVVTLTTNSQESGVEYVLSVSNQITDAAGIALVSGSANRQYFTGFEESDKQPVVHYVSATNIDTIEVEFQNDLKPSSVKLGTNQEGRPGDFDIQVFEADGEGVLPVYGVNFLESGNLLEIKTAQQRSGARYRIQIQDIASAAGVKLKNPISKTFKAIRMRAIQQAQSQNGADLNGDGKVDFIDFTIFSSVYGSVFGGGDAGLNQGLSPIIDNPDSTVPHTSNPAGGSIQ